MVTTNSVVTGINVGDIPELIMCLSSLGIKRMVLSRYYRSTFNHDDKLFVEDINIQHMNKEIDEFDFPVGTTVTQPTVQMEGIVPDESDEMDKFLKRASCAFGRTGLVVTPSGKVIPCEQLPTRHPYVIGDLSRETLSNVWRSDQLLSLLYPERSFFAQSACLDCEHFLNCVHKLGWCMRDIFKVHNSSAGVHPACPRSDHGVRLS